MHSFYFNGAQKGSLFDRNILFILFLKAEIYGILSRFVLQRTKQRNLEYLRMSAETCELNVKSYSSITSGKIAKNNKMIQIMADQFADFLEGYKFSGQIYHCKVSHLIYLERRRPIFNLDFVRNPLEYKICF
jgi:hypothetical protein